MVKISVCEPLRRYCRNEDVLFGDGGSVFEVLKDASKDFPELKKKLFKTENSLSSQVLIYKNLKDIRFLQKENTPVDSTTELKLVVALCGG
ncbi:MAG: MoaD/ThiS family protein [Bacteroidetes bacterium]|nr:MoaD/ThiS family protein [Bacteroidota bacterium]